jgi:carbon storage regulator
MLVLTRKTDECVMIGDDVEVMVVDIDGDQVKIGIEAPREVPIHRKEVYEEIQQENIAAAQADGASDDTTRSVAEFIQEDEEEE